MNMVILFFILSIIKSCNFEACNVEDSHDIVNNCLVTFKSNENKVWSLLELKSEIIKILNNDELNIIRMIVIIDTLLPHNYIISQASSYEKNVIYTKEFLYFFFIIFDMFIQSKIERIKPTNTVFNNFLNIIYTKLNCLYDKLTRVTYFISDFERNKNAMVLYNYIILNNTQEFDTQFLKPMDLIDQTVSYISNKFINAVYNFYLNFPTLLHNYITEYFLMQKHYDIFIEHQKNLIKINSQVLTTSELNKYKYEYTPQFIPNPTFCVISTNFTELSINSFEIIFASMKQTNYKLNIIHFYITQENCKNKKFNLNDNTDYYDQILHFFIYLYENLQNDIKVHINIFFDNFIFRRYKKFSNLKNQNNSEILKINPFLTFMFKLKLELDDNFFKLEQDVNIKDKKIITKNNLSIYLVSAIKKIKSEYVYQEIITSLKNEAEKTKIENNNDTTKKDSLVGDDKKFFDETFKLQKDDTQTKTTIFENKSFIESDLFDINHMRKLKLNLSRNYKKVMINLEKSYKSKLKNKVKEKLNKDNQFIDPNDFNNTYECLNSYISSYFSNKHIYDRISYINFEYISRKENIDNNDLYCNIFLDKSAMKKETNPENIIKNNCYYNNIASEQSFTSKKNDSKFGSKNSNNSDVLVDDLCNNKNIKISKHTQPFKGQDIQKIITNDLSPNMNLAFKVNKLYSGNLKYNENGQKSNNKKYRDDMINHVQISKKITKSPLDSHYPQDRKKSNQNQNLNKKQEFQKHNENENQKCSYDSIMYHQNDLLSSDDKYIFILGENHFIFDFKNNSKDVVNVNDAITNDSACQSKETSNQLYPYRYTTNNQNEYCLMDKCKPANNTALCYDETNNIKSTLLPENTLLYLVDDIEPTSHIFLSYPIVAKNDDRKIQNTEENQKVACHNIYTNTIYTYDSRTLNNPMFKYGKQLNAHVFRYVGDQFVKPVEVLEEQKNNKI